MVMKMEKKRVFVGNLPPHVTKENVTEKFGTFGKVLSVEIKQRQDGSTFAFLDLQIDAKNLHLCFSNVSKKGWDGYQLKLELAKESFLNRLKKEQQEVKSKSGQSMTKDKQIHERNIQLFVDKNAPKQEVKSHTVEVQCKNDSFDHFVSSSSEDDEPRLNRKLPMFRGIGDVYSDSGDKPTNAKLLKFNSGNSLSDDVPKEEKDMLQKFELYSDMWRDSPSHSNPKNYSETSSISKVKASKNERVFGTQKINKIEADDSHKKIISDKMRLKSVEERKKALLQQKQAVKVALASLDSTRKLNKKIVFDVEEDDVQCIQTISHDKGRERLPKKLLEVPDVKKQNKSNLFDEEQSEDENDVFKIKSQFEGKKGQKLLELQTHYGNDKRFTLDERFYESEDGDDSNEVQSESVKEENEKERQMNILQSILGHPISLPKDKEDKQKSKSMLRFDPTKPGHIKFEVKQEVISAKMRKKEALLASVLEKEPVAEPATAKTTLKSKEVAKEVLKEKFYKVSDQLKETLMKSKTENTPFSLLEMFTPGDTGDKDQVNEEEEEQDEGMYSSSKSNKKQIGWTSNPFRYDSSESEEEKEENVHVKSVPDTLPPRQFGVWQESFFFKPNDARLLEGLTFFSYKQEVEENDFSERRRELKRIVKSKIKNNQIKSQKWRRKLGGRKTNKKFRKK